MVILKIFLYFVLLFITTFSISSVIITFLNNHGMGEYLFGYNHRILSIIVIISFLFLLGFFLNFLLFRFKNIIWLSVVGVNLIIFLLSIYWVTSISLSFL